MRLRSAAPHLPDRFAVLRWGEPLRSSPQTPHAAGETCFNRQHSGQASSPRNGIRRPTDEAPVLRAIK